ncbi:non-canonical purine NTP phosphatase [Psychrosphaera saromensis]|uniref:Inosine/xanthosine triphosphatase n=2 Tax=Psychrosphaera saromensis TaxID=716813 RepID=A0A2S7UUX5_9GAMM|nr:inosine/xanthosine triphosphatase [Psychrosphaera saromensis]GHB68312.1 non-canonical purine NTP phosphatase [Psychrosphaera saromensis]GLQ15180.1 non-canonical purine NTP phosphatase [Psychrosphaera saromensis]
MAEIIHLCVGSTNPVKVNAAKKAFACVFPNHVINCTEMKALSGVAEQPMTEAETRLGAQNRVRYCFDNASKANVNDKGMDYWVAMEGGVDKFNEGAASFSYVAVLTKDGDLFTGRSANLPLPRKIFKRLQQGEELGPVMDEIFNTSNIRQKGGAIGLLTNHAATRESVYTQALILALAPALHLQHY